MDFTSIIGLVAGFGLIAFGIMNNDFAQLANLWRFYDPGSIVITVGGTLASTLCSFPISTFKMIPSHFRILVQGKRYNPKKYIDIIVELAQVARRNSLLALEDKATEQDDKFLADSIMLIVDAIEPEKATQILENELDCLDDRHQKGWQMWEKMASYAPAFGMIGTLIGLVNMLGGMDLNSSTGASELTAGMSLALVTTFYGVIMANLMFMPVANKLKCRHNEEMICKEIIIEGVIAIQSGDNPKIIEERLYSYLNSIEKIKKENIEKSGGDMASGNIGDDDNEAPKGKKSEKPAKEKKAKK